MANNNNIPGAPRFSPEFAQGLADKAELQISFIRQATPHFPEGVQINEWKPTEFQILNSFRRIKALGQGASGRVYLEECIAGARAGQVRAVKVLTYDHPMTPPYTAQQVKDYRRRELLSSIFLSGPWCEQHFVKVHSWFEINDVPSLGMELLQGDLARLQLQPRGAMAPEHARVVMAQLLLALRYLHSQQLVHRDIKPQNILVVSMPPASEHWIVKIGDFGNMSHFADVNAKTPIEICGTRGYVPPDVWGYTPNDEASTFLQACKADMFAAGVVLFTLLTKVAPFGQRGVWLKAYALGELAAGFPWDHLIDTQCGASCTELIKLLLAVPPTGRPMASQCIEECQWFQGL